MRRRRRGRNSTRIARAYPAFPVGAEMNSLLELNNKMAGI
jgi:hypothetical protein